MGKEGQRIIFLFSLITPIIIVGLAYLVNYDSILEKTNSMCSYLMLFLLTIDVIANFAQIIEHMRKYCKSLQKTPEKNNYSIVVSEKVVCTHYSEKKKE